MSPRKLTQDDKQAILQLYRDTEETTSTLADRFGVSSSTISRFLKNNLSTAEYEDLIQKKRLGRTGNRSETPTLANPEPTKKTTRVRKRSRVKTQSQDTQDTQDTQETQEKEETQKKVIPTPEASPKPAPILKTQLPADDEDEDLPTDDYDEEGKRTAIEEMFGEDIDDSDDDDEDLEDDDWEDEEEEKPFTPRSATINVLPFSEATLPRMCYLVIDRSAELITRPLREFGDLGKIPAEEVQEKTLPIFENHKVARRFSNRSQRVIKVPDSRMLQKVSNSLEAKGITRLLIDGQIYSVSSWEDH